jgi:S-adenosylmethionine:tRNA ribosyltransferase-isomerase
MPDLSYTRQFNYALPSNLIANEPLSKRDTSRLLLLDRQKGNIQHQHFYDLAELLTPNDVLVFNQSKVFPARLFGKTSHGKAVEIVLFQQISSNTWKAITHPGLRPDMQISFSHGVTANVIMGDKLTGEVDLEFSYPQDNIFTVFDQIGETPIPSYIHSSLSEKELRDRYQTVYAQKTGSAAAPTAGLHFTPELLENVKQKGIQVEYITLHVGLGTFQALRKENFETSKLHIEQYEVDKEVAQRLNQAKKQHKRIIAVGTTTTRTLESIASKTGQIKAGQGTTEIFIYPPYQFKFIDSMITNFHLPQSSLLMLVSAFTSAPNTLKPFSNFEQSSIGQSYLEAIRNQYRFYSFGDAMWIQ